MAEVGPAARDERLLLLAQEPGEVPLVSALVQDAIVRPSDVAWDRRRRRLVLLVDRYRWEANDRTRVRAALRIEGALRVQRRGWTDFDAHDPGITVLALLAFLVEDNLLTIAFASGATLRVEIECVDLVLEDISAPWPTRHEPRHD